MATITCPVCGAQDDLLHHDIRAPLVCAWQAVLARVGNRPGEGTAARGALAGRMAPNARAHQGTARCVTHKESDVKSPSALENSGPAASTPPGPTQSVPFRRVAVCVDGSDVGEVVVLHAAKIAAGLGAPLTIVRVLEPDANADATPPDPLDWDVRQREARASLTRLVSLAARRHADVQSELIQGRAAEQICGWTCTMAPI